MKELLEFCQDNDNLIDLIRRLNKYGQYDTIRYLGNQVEAIQYHPRLVSHKCNRDRSKVSIYASIVHP